LAARKGISLDIVLRRYFAGHTLITDFLIEETENVGTFSSVKTQRLLQSQATLFDRLMAAVSEEYAEEAKRNSRSPGRRRSEQVERLLKGELVDTSELAYDFEGHHLGAIARAPAAAESLREISRSLGCRVLLVAPDEETAWAWLGSRHPKDLEELEQLISSTWTEHAVVALGDPAESLAGWRFTHRQARAALPIAVSSSKGVVRYADVALLASIVQDELLVTSLHRLYLAPLKTDGDGGKMLCQTLRAYFAAERKVSSAAAALGVNRHTVANRLAAIESRLTRPLSSCAAELEVALRLEELGDAVCDPPLSQNADLVQLDLKRRR
jgi:DNA-binding PucR family transcriptional regulator